MANAQVKAQVKPKEAEWQFLFLKRLMKETPVSVRALATLAGVSEPTLGRVRSGKHVKRETAIKVFDALCKIEKLNGKLQERQSDFLVIRGERSTLDIDKFLESL